MLNAIQQFGLNRRPQRKQSSLFPVFAPVQLLLLLALATADTTAQAQCYYDPFTGQTICPRQGSLPQPARPSQRQISNSGPETNSPDVDPASHCRISVGDGSIGSGTLVARNDAIGLVLTCSHLFDRSTSQIVVSFPNGKRFCARLAELDKANDLAALAIRRPDVEPLSVGEREPIGLLTACGFGSNGVFRGVRGQITGHPTAAGATAPSTTIYGAVRSGDSGGGVLDSNGEVVGVVWGQRDGQTYATCGRPVYEFLGRVRRKLLGESIIAAKPTSPRPQASNPQFDWQTWTAELESRIRTLDAKKQDKGDYLQPGDLNRYLRIDEASQLADQFASRSELETKIKGLAARFDSVHTVVESVRQHVQQLGGARAGFLEGLSLTKLAVGALGLSGPVAAALLVVGGLAGRRMKARLRRLETSIGKNEPVAIAIDSPPPPQRTVPETHYVSVERDSFAKAHQWASEQVARKYPGATEILQAQDSLIKQYLAAKT
jgi:hypothetical protein